MISLILILVAVVLVVLLVGATFYYGGSSFSSANVQAQADRLANEGTQIKAAAVLYQADNGNAPQGLDDLTNGSYLSARPANWSLEQSGSQLAYTSVSGTSAQILCSAFNAKYGVLPSAPGKLDNIPACSTVDTTKGIPLCCGDTSN